MISVTILYPKTEDSTFDMDYYVDTHMPKLADALGDACQGWGASSVGAGGWEAIGWMLVDSQASLDVALKEHGAAIMGDVPNYTNVAPQMVVGQVTR